MRACLCEGLFLRYYTLGPFVEVLRSGLIHSVGAVVMQWH